MHQPHQSGYDDDGQQVPVVYPENVDDESQAHADVADTSDVDSASLLKAFIERIIFAGVPDRVTVPNALQVGQRLLAWGRVLRIRGLENLSQREFADRLGISEARVSQLCTAIKAALRD